MLPLSKNLWNRINDNTVIIQRNNPVDVISRGLDAKDLLICNLWFCGPNRLREENRHVEKRPVDLENYSDYVTELKSFQDFNLGTVYLL